MKALKKLKPSKNEMIAICSALFMAALLLDNGVSLTISALSGSVFGVLILACLGFWESKKDIREYKEYREDVKKDVQELAQDRFVEATKVGLSRLKKLGCNALEVGDYCDEAAEFWAAQGVKALKCDRNSSNEWMPGAEARYGLVLSL